MEQDAQEGLLMELIYALNAPVQGASRKMNCLKDITLVRLVEDGDGIQVPMISQ